MKNTLFLLIKFGAVLCEILLPSNTAVMRGDKMNMTCRPKPTNHFTVRKWEIFNSSRTTTSITQEPSGRLRGQFMHLGVERNANGPVSISANATRSSDAGIYTCRREIDGKDGVLKAHLIVLETTPACESNLTRNYTDSFINGDHIWILCRVNYRGFWAPRMEWTQHGEGFGPEGKSITDGIATLTNRSQRVTSTLTIAINSSTNGSYYLCKIYFSKYDDTEETTTADNVPDFTYIWNSSVIYVSNSSTQSVFSVSDAGTPTANTSPAEKPFSVDWYLVSLSLVAAFAIFFIVMVVRAIVRCNRFKKQVSDNYASTNKETIELPTLESSNYEFIPYATSDNYETIGEEDTDPSVVLSLRPRIGQLPTPGYAGLEERKPSAPTVYSRIEGYMSPVDIVPDPTLTKVIVSIEANPGQTFDELETEKTESQRKELLLNAPSYLEVRE